jgi:energy-coupling factor transport system substrate-specific component
VSPRQLALIPVAVALNVAVGRIVAEFNLPVYLDATGTILASALAGPVVGVTTGVLSQVITAMIGGYVWLAFAPVQIIIALLALAGARARMFRSLPVSLGLGASVGVVAGALSAVISYFVFRGVTAGGVTAITTLLTSTGLPLSVAVTASSLATDIVDKSIAFAIVGMALRGLPLRMVARFPEAGRAIRS